MAGLYSDKELEEAKKREDELRAKAAQDISYANAQKEADKGMEFTGRNNENVGMVKANPEGYAFGIPGINSYQMPSGETVYTNREMPRTQDGKVDWKSWEGGMPPPGTGYATNEAGRTETTFPGKVESGVDFSELSNLIHTPPEIQYEKYLKEYKPSEGNSHVDFKTFKEDIPKRIEGMSSAYFGKQDSSGLPGTGEIDTAPSQAEMEERKYISGVYVSTIQKMSDQADKLSSDISNGLHSGRRLKGELELLKNLQEQIPHLLNGSATYSRGIMDIDKDRLVQGKVKIEELKSKLGLTPLEQEEKRAEIDYKKAGIKEREASADYNKKHAEGLPTVAERKENKLEIERLKKEGKMDEAEKLQIQSILKIRETHVGRPEDEIFKAMKETAAATGMALKAQVDLDTGERKLVTPDGRVLYSYQPVDDKGNPINPRKGK